MTEIERDLPTSRAEIVRLRSLRSSLRSTSPADPFAVLQQLVDALPTAAREQRRTTAAGRPEFEL